MAEALYQQTTLLHLNDDCLLEIFEYLAMEELVPLYGHICERIDEIIGIRITRIGKWDVDMRHMPYYSSKQLQFAGSLLNKFKLSAGYSINKAKVLRILQPVTIGASTSGKLRELCIHYVFWHLDYTKCLQLVISNLEILDLSFITLSNSYDLKSAVNNAFKLKSLFLKGVFNINDNSFNGELLDRLHFLSVEVQSAAFESQWETITEIYPNLYIEVYNCSTNRFSGYGILKK